MNFENPNKKVAVDYKTKILDELKRNNKYGRPLNFFVMIVHGKFHFLLMLVTLFIYIRKNHPDNYFALLPVFSFFVVGKSLINDIMIVFELHWEYSPFNERMKELFTSMIIGLCFSNSFYRVYYVPDIYHLNIHYYVLSLCLYHMCEYLYVVMYHYENLSFDSFLINQSWAWIVAQAACFIEYFLEEWFVFESFDFEWPIKIGLWIMLCGQCFRIGALISAERNFNHSIETQKRNDHVLVTTGVYRISRHPSYFGFFYWSVGSQIMLCNPICLVGFAITLWKFFDDRIRYEEKHLIRFFGKYYINYKKRVRTLIPFITGVNIEDYSEEELKLLTDSSRTKDGFKVISTD